MLRLSLSFLILAIQFSAMPALPVQPDRPDPAAVHPSLVLPTAPPTTTIPAFPEQSAATAGGAACPLDLSDDLISGISASCSPLHGRHPSRSRCCPSLAAGLYSAYAATSLSASAAAGDLPALPDDSESCAAAAERAVTGRGVALPRANATCGAAYCYCGIRLRRLSCAFAATAGGDAQGKWAPRGGWARKLEKNCARRGLPGCSLCLRTLNQLKAAAAGDVSLKDGERVAPRGNDCQLMGLTWLLSRNRTRYLPTATAVIRAFMAAEGGAAISAGGEVGPTCLRTADDMPIAVGSSEIGDAAAASGGTFSPVGSVLYWPLMAMIFL